MPQHEQAQTPAPTTDTSIDRAQEVPSTGPGNAVAAANLASAGIPRGGGSYTVVRGDTLYDIATRTYGSGTYWRQISHANPADVFREGELILVGAVLQLPVIRVATTPELTESQPSPNEGILVAVQPEGVCTEYGDFEIYPDRFAEPLPESINGSRNVRRSEYNKIIFAAKAKAEAQRAQVESKVEDLLSRGVFDWAITDTEAIHALTLLGGLPLSQMRTAVGNIPNIGRLIEQLPASARSGESFTRLLIALGPARIGPYLKDLLSYGLFDWCVTDNDARSVVAVLGLLSAANRIKVLGRLGAPMHTRLLENLPDRGSALASGDKDVVRAIFYRAADSDLDLLIHAFEVRFALDVRGAEGASWDAAGLRRCWEVIEALPAGHIEGNPALLQWIRYGDSASGHGGWYADDRFEEDSYGAGFDYTTANLDSAMQRSQSDEDGDGTNEVTDPLHGVNRFNKVVRHEVGHAVDEAIGAEARYCIGKASGGNWTNYRGDAGAAITDMIAAVGGPIQGLTPAVREAFVTAIAGDAKNALSAVQGTAEYQALDAAVQATVVTDPVFGALAMSVDNPWYRHSGGGMPLGGRIYQRSYNSTWTAYDQTARAKKVSEYQFRAPGEWFAEAYAAYYQPNADGTCDHSVLGGIDSTTKTWFDKNVAAWAGD
jgi:hypothetical protein